MMTTKKLITSRDPKGLHAVGLFEAMYNKAKLVDGLNESGQRMNEHPQFSEKLLALILECSSLFPADVEYLKFREGRLSVSATQGAYNEKKWKPFFPSGIDNYTGSNWNDVTSGCLDTKPTKIFVSDIIKNGNYSQFIKDEPQNFFQGIEQALQAVEQNPALVKEVLENRRRIHVPFTNAKGVRFVADVFAWYGKLCVVLNELSYNLVWDVMFGNVVLFPQLKKEPQTLIIFET